MSVLGIRHFSGSARCIQKEPLWLCAAVAGKASSCTDCCRIASATQTLALLLLSVGQYVNAIGRSAACVVSVDR